MLCEEVNDLSFLEDSNDSSESLTEYNLEKAFEDSLHAGSNLPLLKEELRLKIQHERLKRGQEELVLKEEPPKRHLLTLTEVYKKNRRRSQNRQSADRSRYRGKEHEKRLLEMIAQQERIKKDLEEIKDQLSEAKDILKAALHQHSHKCFENMNTLSRRQNYVSLLNTNRHRKT